MAEKTQAAGTKKGYTAARLWTAARTFFRVGVRAKSKSKPKAGLVAALEAKNTVGGAASHTDSNQLVGFIHPGGFVVLTPQRREPESDTDRL
jgi:hypothetical protein